MHVGALRMDLHLPNSGSRKEKRAVVRHLLDASRARFKVAAAEVEHQELTQRCALGFAAVSADARQAEEVLEKLERFVWSHTELEVLSSSVSWLERE